MIARRGGRSASGRGARCAEATRGPPGRTAGAGRAEQRAERLVRAAYSPTGRAYSTHGRSSRTAASPAGGGRRGCAPRRSTRRHPRRSPWAPASARSRRARPRSRPRPPGRARGTARSSARGGGGRRAGPRPASSAETWSGVSPRCRVPRVASETFAVSSETTKTRASVSSERPSAARCRVPRDRSLTGFWVRGRMQPAPTISSPRTSTAPSWSGEYGLKMVASRSADTVARMQSRCRGIRRADLALDHDDGAGGAPAQPLHRLGDLLGHARPGPAAEHAEHAALPQPREGLPQLGLEHDQHGEHSVGEYHAEEIGDHAQLEQEGDQIDDGEHQQAEHDLECPRADEKPEQRVERRTRR